MFNVFSVFRLFSTLIFSVNTYMVGLVSAILFILLVQVPSGLLHSSSTGASGELRAVCRA